MKNLNIFVLLHFKIVVLLKTPQSLIGNAFVVFAPELIINPCLYHFDIHATLEGVGKRYISCNGADADIYRFVLLTSIDAASGEMFANGNSKHLFQGYFINLKSRKN